MIALLRAFAFLRWRLFLNAFRGSRRRDRLERFSRIASVVVPIALFVLLIPALLASSVLSVMGGWAAGSGRISVVGLGFALRVILGIVTFVAILAPALRSIRGGGSSLTRFLLLPIPAGLLYLSDLLSALADPWLLFVTPVLLLLPVGIALSGHFAAAALAFIAGVVMLAFLLGLEASIAHLLALVYRNRRRGEAVTLIALVALSLMGLVPMMMSTHMTHRKRPHAPAAASAPAQQSAAPAAAAAATGDTESPSVAGANPESRAGTSGPSQPVGAGGDSEPRQATAAPSSPSAKGPDSEMEDVPGDRAIWLAIPRWIQATPSDLYGRSVQLGLSGQSGPGALRLGGLLLMSLAFLAFSRVCYLRLLNTPEVSGSYSRKGRSWLSRVRIPGLSSSASAVALASVRLVLRSVSGKMAIYFSPISMLAVLLVLSRSEGWHLRHDILGSGSGPLIAVGGMLVALTTLQRIMLNQFAVDGAGLTLELLSPISSLDLVVGKAAGMALLYAGPSAAYILFTLVLTPEGPLAIWLAAPIAGASAFIVFAPIGAILSALFPKTADLNRIGKSNNPNSMASFAGFFLIMILFGPPVGLGALVMFATGSAVGALAAVIVWFGIAVAIAVPLFRIAARVVGDRRENLALVAQGR